MPVAEDLTGTLDLEVFLSVFGRLIVKQSMRVLIPSEYLYLKSESRSFYVAGLIMAFIIEI